jgi:hypothetical protein
MTQATFATHEVLNQSPPFEDVDLFALDRPLVDAVAANGGASAAKELSEFGKHWGSAAMAARGRVANENTPKLRTFDSRGNRRDEVEFHPAYHELMAHSAHAGVHNSTWTAQGKPAGAAAEVVRAAKFYIAAQVETGHLCPITMTRASVAALAAQPELLAKTMPVIATRAYDPGFAPWWTKRGMTLGMGMTEKQGGTDVRSNMTRAERDGDAYRITGHKWFMSAPMCDAFLVLAQAPGGLTCFLMPRFRPDGAVNGLIRSQVYGLSASAGDVYLIRLLRPDTNTLFRPRIDIYDPSGAPIPTFINTTDLARNNFTIQADGNYTLVVTDSYDNSQSGSYSLSLLRLNRPCNAGTLSCGVPVPGTLPRALASSVSSYSAAAGNHQPLGTGYDVTLAKCRIAFDCNGGETDLVLAIAGASRDQLVAIAKRIRQFGIGLAVLGCGAVDIAAIDDFGFARRAKAAACCCAALAVRGRHRKVTPVAGAHAIRLRAAGVIADARTRVVLGSEEIALAPKRQPDHGMRAAAPEPAEQCGEKVLGVRGGDESQHA